MDTDRVDSLVTGVANRIADVEALGTQLAQAFSALRAARDRSGEDREQAIDWAGERLEDAARCAHRVAAGFCVRAREELSE